MTLGANVQDTKAMSSRQQAISSRHEAIPNRQAATSNRQEAMPSAQEAMVAGIWKAHLNLTLGKTTRGVRLTNSDRRGPLYTQKALYPEGENLPHLYLLHPPGGLVSGDHLEVGVEVGEGANALITSPGAGQLYGARADQRPQRQDNRLTLKSKSSLEWFPMETLVYSGANAETNTQVLLDEDSHFIGWDICALGLPTSDAPFAKGALRQTFEIYDQGNPQVIERIALNAEDKSFLNSPAGFAGMTCNALFVAGPFPKATVSDASKESEFEEAKAKLVDICNENCSGLNVASSKEDSEKANKPGKAQSNARMGVSQQGDWLVVRYLGDSTTLAREAFVECWIVLRPVLMQREACLPRIWAC